jgi:hypothetical protein
MIELFQLQADLVPCFMGSSTAPAPTTTGLKQ